MGVCPDRKNLRLYRRKSGSLPLSVPQSAQRLLYGKADGDYEAEGAGNPKGARHPTGGVGASIGGFASDHRFSGKREI